MYITRKPPAPVTITFTTADGFEEGEGYVLTLTNEYSVALYDTIGTVASGVLEFDLPDYFLRYDAEYRMEIYVALSYPDEPAVGDLVYVDTLTIERPYVDPAILAEPSGDVETATQYEALARSIIDSMTDSFKYKREIVETTGLGNDYLPIAGRLNKIVKVYENGVCVYDTENTDPDWVNSKEYYVSTDRSAITMRVTGTGTYNRYQSKPTKISRQSSDSFTPYDIDFSGKDVIDAADNYSFFPSGWDYTLVVETGWPIIPADIQRATKLLYNDLICNNLPYANAYMKEFESDQYTVKFDPAVFGGTGNKIVDKILSSYAKTMRGIGVL